MNHHLCKYIFTDDEIRNNKPQILSSNKNSRENSEEYVKTFKDALSQLQNYIQHEATKLNDIHQERSEMNPTSDTNEEEGEVDRPFMTGGYSFEKRMISNAKDRKRPFMTGGNSFGKRMTFDAKDRKRPFMTGGYSFGKRMISNAKDRKVYDTSLSHSDLRTGDGFRDVRIQSDPFDKRDIGNNEFNVGDGMISKVGRPFSIDYNFEKRFNNAQLLKETKRPFVFSSGYKFGKRSKYAGEFFDERKRPFVLGGGYKGYKLRKRFHGDHDFTVERKRPFVLSGGYKGYKFGKRFHGDHDFTVERKRPFVFSSGGYKFGKRSHGEGEFFDERKRPFVFSGSNQFGKRFHGDSEFFDERKRPFVFSGGYQFGKRSVRDGLIPFIPYDGGNLIFTDKRSQSNDLSIENKPSGNNKHLEKRPFVMSGGYSTHKKRPFSRRTSYRKNPIFIGSGFRFGKRQHWEKDPIYNSEISIDSKESNPSELLFDDKDNSPSVNIQTDIENSIVMDKQTTQLEDGQADDISQLENGEGDDISQLENGEGDDISLLNKDDYINKRPFIMSGLYQRHIKRPILVSNSWKLPMRVGSGFRFGKRDDTGSEIYHFDNFKQKRRFVMNFGKREREMIEMPTKFERRSFSFRNDYHFNKLRQQSKTYNDKRPIYLDRPFSVNYRNNETEKFSDRGGYVNNKRNDEQQGEYDTLNPEQGMSYLPFYPMKRPFMTSGGGFRSKIGKRPFVIGSSRGYKFGK